MLALSDLFKPETREEVLSTILTTAGDLQLKITAWQSGQPVRTMLTTFSQKLADLTSLTREAIKGGLLDEAEGDWLTLLAFHLYRVTRRLATAAQGDSFTVTNLTDGAMPIAAGELVIAHSVTNKTYRNLFDLNLAPGTNTGLDFIADELGSGSNAAPGMITQVVASFEDITVTNVDSVLGNDEETDPDLRTRCRSKLGSLSPNGPKEAYAYVATTPELAPVVFAITRTRVIADPLTGFLTLVLATATGAPDPGDVTIVNDAIDVWATPWCTTASAAGAEEVLIAITYQVWVRGTNLTPTQIQNAIATALAVYFQTIAIGGDEIPPDSGKVFVDTLKQVIGTATPGIVKVLVSVPVSDVDIGLMGVAKLSTITPTVTVLQ